MQTVRGWVRPNASNTPASPLSGDPGGGGVPEQLVSDSNVSESQPADMMPAQFAPSMSGRRGRDDLLLAREWF